MSVADEDVHGLGQTVCELSTKDESISQVPELWGTDEREVDMTREEAIQILKDERWYMSRYSEEYAEAYDMAISALSAEKMNIHEVACVLADLFGDTCACNYCDIDSWLPQYCDFANTCCPNTVGVACWEQYLTHKPKVEKYAFEQTEPSGKENKSADSLVTNKPNDDKESECKLSREDARYFLQGISDMFSLSPEAEKSIDMAIEALEREEKWLTYLYDDETNPCETCRWYKPNHIICYPQTEPSDLISRADAIDAIEDTDWYHIHNGEMVHGSSSEHESWYKHDDIFKALNEVPSVSAERVNSAEWVKQKEAEFETIRAKMKGGAE